VARVGQRTVIVTGRVAFTLGGRLTPRIAARAAAKVWSRLPSARRLDNRPYPGTIERIDVGGGRRLAVETWGEPAAPLVYLVHGWGGWRGQVASFVQPLVAAGHRVLAFDALSHGDSDPGAYGPRYSSGGELIESLELIADLYGPAHGAIGHSLGCGAICRAIVEDRFAVERLTLVAPNPDLTARVRIFGRQLGFPPRTIRLLETAAADWAHRSMDDFNVAYMGATGRLPDALVIHDRQDQSSTYATAEDIDREWPGARLMTTQTLGHHRILITPGVIAAAVSNIG
jgi:pimeloyl-ACP methyl ester carboxylesterase